MPPKSSKRKLELSQQKNTKSLRSSRICFLHVEGIQHGDFTPLNKVRGLPDDKINQLNDIKKRRLAMPLGSPYRLEEICRRIPDNLNGIDIESNGFHRGCYQNFTKNLDRLQTYSDETAKIHRSPRKQSSKETKFPPVCIFCVKSECKHNGKTERCTKFAVFKENNIRANMETNRASSTSLRRKPTIENGSRRGPLRS